ncbi:MAG: AAA family ATPase, partial [Novipirellula sp. JB048]
VIVMTSNAGSQVIRKLTEEDASEREMHEAVQESLRSHFLPEFLNRIDDVVIFKPLDRQQIRQIVKLQLQALDQRLQENGLHLEVSEAAVDEIASAGYDPVYGARPLKRVIQNEVQNRLATALLKNAYPEGSTVKVDFEPPQFVFTGEPSEE